MHMNTNSAFGQTQPVRNLLVREALPQQEQYLAHTTGQLLNMTKLGPLAGFAFDGG